MITKYRSVGVLVGWACVCVCASGLSERVCVCVERRYVYRYAWCVCVMWQQKTGPYNARRPEGGCVSGTCTGGKDTRGFVSSYNTLLREVKSKGWREVAYI